MVHNAVLTKKQHAALAATSAPAVEKTYVSWLAGCIVSVWLCSPAQTVVRSNTCALLFTDSSSCQF